MSLALVSCKGGVPLPAQIEAVFRSAHENGEFDGSVLVTRDGRTIYQGSFGFADAAAGLVNTAATRFAAYSLMKPLTATLVFQEIERGRLAPADRLEKFFPVLAGSPAGAITLEQLLTHTSGIEEVISRHPDRRIVPADLRNAVVSNAGQYAYSNTGFVCLALVLEATTGRGLAEVFEQQIFMPAGMRESGLLRSGRKVDGLATGYRREGGQRVLAPLGVSPEAIDGAGSLYTTTGDLARFDQALRDGRILSPVTQAQMLKPVDAEHCRGWFLAEQGGKYFPWQQGSFHGFSAVFVRQIQRGEAIVILSNDESTNVLGLRTKVLRLLKADAARTGG